MIGIPFENGGNQIRNMGGKIQQTGPHRYLQEDEPKHLYRFLTDVIKSNCETRRGGVIVPSIINKKRYFRKENDIIGRYNVIFHNFECIFLTFSVFLEDLFFFLYEKKKYMNLVNPAL